MKEKFKGLLVGLLLGGLISSTAVYAAGTTKIDVIFDKIKFMVDGVEKVPTTGQGFIYQGTTYVPLRFAAEATNKDVAWDGKNKTVWIGKKEGEFVYLSDLTYARVNDTANYQLSVHKSNVNSGSKLIIAQNTYIHGLSQLFLTEYVKPTGSIEYNINGKYKKLTGFVGIDDSTKNTTNPGKVIVYGDGQEIYSSNDLKGGDLPIPIAIDVTGVLKLKIEFIYTQSNSDQTTVSFAEPKLSQ